MAFLDAGLALSAYSEMISPRGSGSRATALGALCVTRIHDIFELKLLIFANNFWRMPGGC
jgi:hypothetical protein